MKAVYGEGRAEAARRDRECETTEVGAETGTKKTRNAASTTDGASIEVARRPRGRPPGSKNKPKPPLVITREAPESSSFRSHILQVPGGVDVVDAITRFARRRRTGLCILTGNGAVANVTLRHATSPTTVSFHGRFEILSISAVFLPPSSSSSPSLSSLSNGFTVSLVGAQGQIVGGSVAGSLLSVGTVVIVAAGFLNPSYHRLVGEDEFSASGVSLCGSEMKTHLQNQDQEEEEEEEQQHHHQQGHDDHHLMDSSGVGMSVYSCHLPSDVIWAPIARPPPPF